MSDQYKMTDKTKRTNFAQSNSSGSGWIAAIIVVLLLVIGAWYVSSSNPVANTMPVDRTTPSNPTVEPLPDPMLEPAPAPSQPAPTAPVTPGAPATNN